MPANREKPSSGSRFIKVNANPAPDHPKRFRFKYRAGKTPGSRKWVLGRNKLVIGSAERTLRLLADRAITAAMQ